MNSVASGLALKTLPLFISFGLFSCSAAADQIFRITFSGTMLGEATGRFEQTNGTNAQVDLTGATVSGFLDYNLSLAPGQRPTVRGDEQLCRVGSFFKQRI